MQTKHYGTVENIIGNEGEGIGNLSVAAMLDPSDLAPKARIVVGSTSASPVDLGQFCATYQQAAELVRLLQEAMADIAKIAPHATVDDAGDE